MERKTQRHHLRTASARAPTAADPPDDPLRPAGRVSRAPRGGPATSRRAARASTWPPSSCCSTRCAARCRASSTAVHRADPRDPAHPALADRLVPGAPRPPGRSRRSKTSLSTRILMSRRALLVGQLVEHLADDLVHIPLVVPEVVGEGLERRPGDLELRRRQVEPVGDLVRPDEVQLFVGHACGRTTASSCRRPESSWSPAFPASSARRLVKALLEDDARRARGRPGREAHGRARRASRRRLEGRVEVIFRRHHRAPAGAARRGLRAAGRRGHGRLPPGRHLRPGGAARHRHQGERGRHRQRARASAEDCERLDRLHYVSTAYVAGVRKGAVYEHELSLGQRLQEPLRVDQVPGRGMGAGRDGPHPHHHLPPGDRGRRLRRPARPPSSTARTTCCA